MSEGCRTCQQPQPLVHSERGQALVAWHSNPDGRPCQGSQTPPIHLPDPAPAITLHQEPNSELESGS